MKNISNTITREEPQLLDKPMPSNLVCSSYGLPSFHETIIKQKLIFEVPYEEHWHIIFVEDVVQT
jgi:hypothetical protein